MSAPAMNAAAAELREWYASHSIVRRLWAFEGMEAIRVVLTLEPTNDDDDTQPAWLANSWTWAQELEGRMHRIVHLEMLSEPSRIDSICAENAALIARLSWCDPTLSAE